MISLAFQLKLQLQLLSPSTIGVRNSRMRSLAPFKTCSTAIRSIVSHRAPTPLHIRHNSSSRIDDACPRIEDEYATLRSSYRTPKNPIVLAHGLFGFDELRLAGSYFPGVQYWRGITEALKSNGIEAIATSVPPSGSIEKRAEKLSQEIYERAGGKSVNIIAHSMGGLDSRYMISRINPPNVKVLSLTTIATPHRGSAFADYFFKHTDLGMLKRVLSTVGLETEAMTQLTREYMAETFNPDTPDVQGVRYFSYGATCPLPSYFSVFRTPHKVVDAVEGENDCLVSVESAKWGTYKGTLVDVSHLDLINWTNRVKWAAWAAMGKEKK